MKYFLDNLFYKILIKKIYHKLHDAKITIVGLGGIGCPLSQYLVSSGLKHLTLFDGDIIEKTNLARQILYSLDDIGKYKTNGCKRIDLLKTNPNCKLLHTQKI